MTMPGALGVMTCPACRKQQNIVGQWDKGVVVTGVLLVLDCAHAWELIAPRVVQDASRMA